jgi:adenine phosphoribosyltransferase
MDLKNNIRVIEDFPKEGISFKDITTLTKNADAFKYTIERFTQMAIPLKADLIVGPEARGFIMGAPVAFNLGIGFIPIRKPGKLPGEIESCDYDLEYGKNTIEIHKDAIKPGDRILIVDDLIATGGTNKATIELIEKLGGKVVGVFVLIELTELKGKEKIADYYFKSLVEYPF